MVEVAGGRVWRLPAQVPAADARLDAAGRRIAYVSGGALWVIEVDGSRDRVVAEPDGPHVTFGAADHAGAASLGEPRGHWWSPDGTRLLVARVDVTAVPLWPPG